MLVSLGLSYQVPPIFTIGSKFELDLGSIVFHASQLATFAPETHPFLSPLLVGDQKNGRGGAPKKASQGDGTLKPEHGTVIAVCRIRESVDASWMLANASISQIGCQLLSKCGS